MSDLIHRVLTLVPPPLPHTFLRLPSPLPAVLLLAVAAALASCGSEGPPKAATQAAARVDGREITVHQVNAVLRRQPAPLSTAESGEPGSDSAGANAAARLILERLIDQDIAVHKARELELDRDPAVVQDIEAARRDILARAWAERAAQAAASPGEEELRRHYEANASLYGRRREFSLQEIAVEATPQQVQALRQRLAGGARVSDLLQALRQEGVNWRSVPAQRSAEQLPPAALQAIEALRDGQAVLSNTPRGALVLVRLASREQPLSFEAARPLIEQRLREERRREIVLEDLKSLRALARIDYLGPFAVAAPDTSPPAQAASENRTQAPAR